MTHAKPRKKRESFGRMEQKPSGRWRASYLAPDKRVRAAPTTFATKAEGRAWLARVQTSIADGTWLPPEVIEARRKAEAAEARRREVTLSDYAAQWIGTRTNSKGEAIRIRTREEYERMLRPAGTKHAADLGGPLAPLLDEIIGEITPEQVREWRSAALATGKATQTARAYDLLKSILKTAAQDGIIAANPCTIRGGSTTRTGKKVEPPTDEELAGLIDAIGEKYRALVVIAAIGGLRFGEAIALQAKDVAIERDENGGVRCARICVDKAVVNTQAQGRVIGPVKASASVRKIAIFGEGADIIARHSRDKIRTALLFPAITDDTRFLSQPTFYRHWKKTRAAVGRPDMPFHALRHYAGTRYAQTGATVKETMARLGHSSERAAMRYQHSGNRDDELAMRMSRLRNA